jgi:hypothetical protein
MADPLTVEEQSKMNLDKAIVLLDYVNKLIPSMLSTLESLNNAEEWGRDKLLLSNRAAVEAGKEITLELARIDNIRKALVDHGDRINRIIESIKER